MGKASRNKRLSIDSALLEAIRLSSEIVRSTAVLSTFLSSKMAARMPEHAKMAASLSQMADLVGDAKFRNDLDEFSINAVAHNDDPLQISAESWAKSFAAAFRIKPFVELLTRCTTIAHQEFWSSNASTALQFDNNKAFPPESPIVRAIERAHRRLVADPAEPRWTTLAIFCLGRMIAVNANRSFESNEWSELSLTWFDLERNFLLGNGTKVANLVLSIDRDYFDEKLPEMIGSLMLHGLAEMAINASDKDYFR